MQRENLKIDLKIILDIKKIILKIQNLKISKT